MKVGAAGTAVVTLGKHSKRVRGIWQKRSDGVMFFAFAEPFRATMSAHHMYVSAFEEDK